MDYKKGILLAQAPGPSPAPSAPTPPRREETTHDLLAEGTPTIWPTVYALAPQNNKKEILQTECAIESRKEERGKREAVFVCPFETRRIKIFAQTTLDSGTGNWSSWGYRALGKNFSNRSLIDKGIALTFDGQTLTSHPFENHLEIEKQIATYLAAATPLPQNASLKDLDITEERRKVTLAQCEPEPDVTLIKENDHINGVARNFICPAYYVTQKPGLIAPLTVEEKGVGKLYSLGLWSWFLPGPTGKKRTFEARNNQSIALFHKWAEDPILFSKGEELLEELTERVFPEPSSVQAVASPYGQDYGRVFSPSACRFGDTTTDTNRGEQRVDGECDFSSGSTFHVALTRRYNIAEEGALTLFTVTEWDYAVQTPGGNRQTGRVEKGILTVSDNQGQPLVLQYDTEVERDTILQRRYERSLEGQYLPAALILKGGLGLIRGNHFGSSAPSVGDRRSQGAGKQHGNAVALSEGNSFDNTENGLFGNLALEFYPLGALGESIGGPFFLGALEGGYAGKYDEKNLQLLELQAGVGISLRELAGWRNPFDFSFHYPFYRGRWTNEEELLRNEDGDEGWLPFQLGACLEYGKLNACLDYSQNDNENSEEEELNLLKFSLGWELFKAHRRRYVEVAK